MSRERNIKDFNKFVSEVDASKAVTLGLLPLRHLDGSAAVSPGHVADVRYDISYSARDKLKTRIFREGLFVVRNEVWLTHTEVENADVRRSVGSLLLSIVARVDKLNRVLSNTEVGILDSDTGEFMEAAKLEMQMTRAIEAGAVIYPDSGSPMAPASSNIPKIRELFDESGSNVRR